MIVPSHNQSKHIESIIRSYEKQTLRPDLLLFVFDRCEDDSVNIIGNITTDLNVSYVEKKFGSNFSAGMTRDYGYDKLLSIPDTNFGVVIFTDGDCYPNETVVEDHYFNCTIRDTPIVSCGRRMMQDKFGEFQEDERMSSWAQGYSFVNRNARMISSTRTSIDSIFTYSCNLAFNIRALELCRNVNSTLSINPRIFNSEFDGSWGGEDNFISDIMFRTGNFITLSDHRSCVYHYWHEPSVIEDNRRRVWKDLSYRLSSAVFNKIIDGPITIVERNRFVVEPMRFCGVLNNIHRVIENPTIFNSNIDLYFHSRNFQMVKPNEDRPRINVYLEEALEKEYDFSAFRKFFLTPTEIIEDTDVENYNYERYAPSSKCSYCNLNS